jgi:hypothetical protein
MGLPPMRLYGQNMNSILCPRHLETPSETFLENLDCVILEEVQEPGEV